MQVPPGHDRRRTPSELHTPRTTGSSRGGYQPPQVSPYDTSLFDDAPPVDDDVLRAIDLGGTGDDVARVGECVFFGVDRDGF